MTLIIRNLFKETKAYHNKQPIKYILTWSTWNDPLNRLTYVSQQNGKSIYTVYARNHVVCPYIYMPNEVDDCYCIKLARAWTQAFAIHVSPHLYNKPNVSKSLKKKNTGHMTPDC